MPQPIVAEPGTETPGVTAYPRSFFDDAQPATAFEMIARLPGFSFVGGDDQVRGLAGAVGNVLIDGNAHTSKGVTLEDALRRIPAIQVERIELIRGGAPGIDMQGFAVVANVIRTGGSSAMRVVETRGRVFPADKPGGGMRGEWSQRTGNLVIDATAAATSELYEWESGRGELRRNTPSVAIDNGKFDVEIWQKQLIANGAVEYRDGPSLYKLSLGWDRNDVSRNETAELARPEEFLRFYAADELEANLTYERRISSKVVGRATALQRIVSEKIRAGLNQELSDTRATSGESILFASARIDRSAAMTIETGVEAAFNFLEQASTLMSENANVRVEELRVQPFATVTWRPLPSLSVDAGMRYEQSTIAQSGDTDSERRFNFLKPKLAVSFEVTPLTLLRLRIERELEQLNFENFVATAGLSGGGGSAGNANLEPERAWIFEAAVEQRFSGNAAAIVTYRREAVQQTWDWIPVGLDQAIGNIGAGVRDVILVKLNLPLPVRGLRADIDAEHARSRVTDPLTGEKRNISGNTGLLGRFNLILERPEIKSSFALEGYLGFTEFVWRIDEIQKQSEHPHFGLYWDWVPRQNLSLRTQIHTASTRTRRRERIIFAGTRDDSKISLVEKRTVTLMPSLSMRVRMTF